MFLVLDLSDVNGYVPLVPPVKEIQLVPSHPCKDIIKIGISYSLGCLASRIIMNGYVGEKNMVLFKAGTFHVVKFCGLRMLEIQRAAR
jgi:hypothetical protein